MTTVSALPPSRPTAADQPWTLTGGGRAWTVETGRIDVFARRLGPDGAPGRRHYLFSVEAGGAVLSVGAEAELELLAVGVLGTHVRSHPAASLSAAALGEWAARLCDSVAGARIPAAARLAVAGEVMEMADGEAVAGHGGHPQWLVAEDGALALGDGDRALPVVPVSSRSWARALSPVRVRVWTDMPEAVAESAIAALHREVLAAIHRDLARRDARAEDRETAPMRSAAVGLSQGFGAIASAIAGRPAAGEADTVDPHGRVCREILGALGLPSPPPQDSGSALDVAARLAAAGVRVRKVLLRGDWWRESYGPMVARRDDGPVALLPDPAGGYLLVDPVTGARAKVTPDMAGGLAAEAVIAYPRLPDRVVSWRRFAGFAFTDSSADSRRILLLGIVGALLAAFMPVATGLLFEYAIPTASVGDLWQIGVGLLAAALGGSAFEAARALAVLRLEGRVDWRAQAALFDRLLRLPVGFFKGFTIGDLAERALSVHHVRALLSSAVLGGMMGALFALPSLAVLFFYNWRLALIAVALVAAGAAALAWAASRQLVHEAERLAHRGRVQGLVLQLLSGIAKLRVAAAEGRGLGAWAKRYAEQQRSLVASQRWANASEIFMAAFPLAATLIIYAAAAWLLREAELDLKLQALLDTDKADRPQPMTAADFVAFSAAFGQFMAAMTSGALALTGVLGAIPYLRRARPILDAAPEAALQRRDPGRLRGGIEVNGVSFRYGPGTPLVLERLSLAVEPGSFVAVVGTSGSGKSTLLRLLTGFEAPERGEVCFDGRPLGSLKIEAVRRQLGVVLQHGRILSGSVLANIVGNSGLGPDEAWRAARQVGLDRDIEAMPMGMHTVLLDGGVSLSGGQRQRLMIARALVKQPAILLLDEATSALDNLSQSVVADSLARIAATRIVVAHRLSTIRQADRILVLEAGRLVEEGTYDHLIDRGGAFAALARRQLI